MKSIHWEQRRLEAQLHSSRSSQVLPFGDLRHYGRLSFGG